MSSWGMNDGAALTGSAKWTNGAATFIDGTSGPNTTFVTDGLETGDALVGADGLIYRVTAVTSETAATIDRVYEGSTSAATASVIRMKLPRWIKITNDDGTGKTIQDLGILGITNAERSAGVDNLSAVGEVLVGSCHRTVPAVTVAAPPTNTIAVAKVVTADNTIGITNHGLRTGTKLTYLSSSGSVIAGLANNTAYFVIGKETSDSGTTMGDLTANTFALASSLSNAQAGTALALTGTGHASQTLIGDTATATATLVVGKVSKIAIASVGSAYTSAPTVTLAAPATETVDASDAAVCVLADDEFVVSSAFYGVIASGDPVTYADGGGTAVTGLTTATLYYLIKSATSNRVGLATTKSRAEAGTNITFTVVGVGTSHTLIGQTPTATATLGMGTPGTTVGASEVAHIGWVKKTIGTGGRAGRVFYETLVAASSITGDAEDLATPDS
jgi:hypothetical protein